MSAASTASPTIVRSQSSSRRQLNYTATPADRPHRTQSVVTKPATTSSTPHRTNSQSHSHARPTTSSQQAPLAGVARRDYETTSLARPSSSRRNSSRDASYAAPSSNVKTEVSRSAHRSSSRPGHSRYNSDASQTGLTKEALASNQSPSSVKPQVDNNTPGNTGNAKKRTTIHAATGEWALSKTIGAGSMGKVKLARCIETGEQVAVKIVPRQSTDEHYNNRERERADHSKEIRTAREAAIVTLLDHPYICAMRDVVRTNYHWYMLFEYVNGGQMLDYIISHGRLKEKQARKFGRQIASALDYCHRNSIVHRDLKIENILISKTGDIKIIDFGLSNLFSPRSSLKTFCGSLYFAAPELLQARQYTGPEVDVWSFGIVLYVLVCGKVPFDDQSMPQLHAKIKKGVVDYPGWLSPECKNLISRMLVTDPKQRAGLGEILNHPWITKGYNTPPENYLPHREPIQLPLDPAVIRKMTGFDFGSFEYISKELTKVIESDEYQTAVRLNARENSAFAQGSEKKRGVFDFYKRRNSIASRDALLNQSVEAFQLGSDPINAFNPLLSIYYLAREKQERERQEINPGALNMPVSPGEQPLKIPDLPAPEAAYTNSATYEMPGERATGGRSRPRARTHGEDEVAEGIKKVNLNLQEGQVSPAVVTPTMEQIPIKKESAAVGLLRRFSTRRNRDPTRDRTDAQPTPSLHVQPPNTTPPLPRKSFSVRKPRNKELSPPHMLHPGGSQPNQPELLQPTLGETGFKAGRSLNRASSVNSADLRKRQARRAVSDSVPGSPNHDPPATSSSDRSSVSGPGSTTNEPMLAEKSSSLHPRMAASRAKSLGHARRESIQARRSKREEVREANVPEETDQQLAADEEIREKIDSPDNLKPVYLKGLFSVSTTSNKPLSFIRADIIRVLNQLGVDYSEIKGGFGCRHAPSIDLNRVVDNSLPTTEQQGMGGNTNRRRISFGGFRDRDRDRDDFREVEKSSRTNKASSRRHPPDTSFTNSEGSEEESVSPRNGERQRGETTTHVQSDFGANLMLRFEIFIVKVPLFSLHGIQFKKVAGGTWQYKNMAQKILDALRL